jgi:regulator of cell morphogenesis and NO signaling
MSSLTQAVDNLILERPARARVFDEMGIDFAGRRQTLAEACRQSGVDPKIVLERLDRADREIVAASTDCSRPTLGELCAQIVAEFHAPLKEELSRIGTLLYRVAEGAGEHHPELNRVLRSFSLLAGDLKLHMTKEENILFPLIEELETASADCGDLSTLIERLEQEDVQAVAALREIRQLTRDFTPPGDACETYREVLSALRQLERAIFEHAGIENNILFPRVCQLERMRGSTAETKA